MREVGGHQDRVSGRKGAGLAVTHAGVHLMGAFTGASPVAADGHVEGCKMRGGARKFTTWLIVEVFHPGRIYLCKERHL